MPSLVSLTSSKLAALLHSGDDVRRVCCVTRDERLKEERSMLMTIAVILLIAWLLGIVGTYTIGAFVHVLLVIAIVLFLVSIISGRRTVL
jgi:hypothetical protein